MLNRPILILLAATMLLGEACLADDGTLLDPGGDSMLLSNIHLWEGDQHLLEGDIEQATEHYLKASRYMRASPDPHFALARVYVRSSLMDSFLEFTTGLKFLITDFFYQSLVVSNLVLILLLAGALSVYVAATIIVIRHAETVWHSIVIAFSHAFGKRYIKVIILGCLFSFFMLISGRSLVGILTWTIVIGGALAWRFTNTSERRMLIGFAIFLILLGPVLNAGSWIISTQHPDSPLRLAALADRIDDERLSRYLGQTLTSHRFDSINEFMRGLLHLKEGNYPLAIERFNLASKFSPDNAAILNNLGVAFHSLERYEEAEARFREALRLAPREAVIHYNYSQTLNALLRYDLAQEELATASTLDFDLTRALVTAREGTALVPMNLQTRVLWQMAMDSQNRRLQINYHPIESGAVGVFILVVLAAGALALIKKTSVPARCDICGVIVQVQVAKRKRKDVLCQACGEIKTRNGNNHDRLESELETRIRRKEIYQTMKRVVMGLILPGSSYHIAGRRSKGFMISFSIFVLLIIALSGGTLIEPVPKLSSKPTTGWVVFLLAAVYCVYAWRSTVTAINSVRED